MKSKVPSRHSPDFHLLVPTHWKINHCGQSERLDFHIWQSLKCLLGIYQIYPTTLITGCFAVSLCTHKVGMHIAFPTPTPILVSLLTILASSKMSDPVSSSIIFRWISARGVSAVTFLINLRASIKSEYCWLLCVATKLWAPWCAGKIPVQNKTVFRGWTL